MLGPGCYEMDTAIDLSDASKALDLSHIRFQLIRLEDTITFHLIERVQFPLNRTIYMPGALQLPDTGLSFLDWMLQGQERLHSMVRRYQSPDEYPFFPQVLETPILKPLDYPRILHPNSVNVNEKLKRSYTEHILPAACTRFEREDRGEGQENYGSAGTCDVACLQALSRRVHFGKFVAEAKFRQESERFTRLILAEDRAGIAAAITDDKVEKKVLERLGLKAKTYGTDPALGATGPGKINVDAVVAMYKVGERQIDGRGLTQHQDHVIPLTKEVEVEYLMQRLDHITPRSNGS
ncbi:MAG: chorismate mutase aro7 [Thelocarpon impressellum]|nr:MAG: chorismate mutase aro7 [Thelocarpon impressellum]